MASVKSLAKDTAIYGLSSIVGRFLNWCLVPLYTNMFSQAEFGMISLIYSVVAMTLIILTYGLETGFFRFANHERFDNPMEVYSTCLISLAASSSIFLALLFALIAPISDALECSAHPSYVWLMGAAVAMDAFTALPFSYLRYRNRALRFATLKFIGIVLNIGFNLFFILLCPIIWKSHPASISWFYNPEFGIGYVFLTNFITSAAALVLLIPELRGFKWKFNNSLWRSMISYSLPLLILGLAGIMNQNLDKILLPKLLGGSEEAMSQLGIYSANYKIAIIMVMFIQAFRFAYEPFIFAQNREKGADKLQSYRDAMKWFVVFAMIIFLGVMFYIDILKYFISPAYFSGLKVVPIVMMAEFFFGVFFNLSLWYKLTDRTIWGTWFSLIGLAITIGMNILLIPRFGYIGCAWTAFCCYGVMMVSSYFVGRAKYPIGYNVGRLSLYTLSAVALYGLSILISTQCEWLDMAVRTVLLILYITFVVRHEKISIRQLIPRKIR